MILWLIAGSGILLFFTRKNSSELGSDDMKTRLYGLKDIVPEKQKGGYNTDYDLHFLAAADEFRLPFALLKAQALAESSLKASAFLDENPKKLPERQGWASRGLMQILWWPGSQRWKKYGYPDEDLGIDGIRMFEPNVNVRIAAQLIRDNLHASKGNIRDTINMYNTGKKEAVFKAPNGYVDKVYNYYMKILGES